MIADNYKIKGLLYNLPKFKYKLVYLLIMITGYFNLLFQVSTMIKNLNMQFFYEQLLKKLWIALFN